MLRPHFPHGVQGPRRSTALAALPPPVGPPPPTPRKASCTSLCLLRRRLQSEVWGWRGTYLDLTEVQLHVQCVHLLCALHLVGPLVTLFHQLCAGAGFSLLGLVHRVPGLSLQGLVLRVPPFLP